jgi:peptide subunit release factor 1 (eRF1)
MEGHRLEEFQSRLPRETAGDGRSNRRLEKAGDRLSNRRLETD